MNIRLTGAMAALAAALMVAPAALAHGGFAPHGGQGYGPMMGHGGMMDQEQGRGYGQHGMMGHGQRGMMGHGGMMGYGQADPQGCGKSGGMGQGQGQGGMMGNGPRSMMGAAPLAEDLSVDGVTHIMEHRVAMRQNPNLKVGEVTEVDDDTIAADVVTQDGSLVRRYMVDRHTGMMRPADMTPDKEQ